MLFYLLIVLDFSINSLIFKDFTQNINIMLLI